MSAAQPSNVRASSRHRRHGQQRRRGLVLVGAVGTVGLVVALGVVTASARGGPNRKDGAPCPDQASTLRVVVAPEVAEAVKAASRALQLTAGQREAGTVSGDACPPITVTPRQPADVASELANGPAAAPDVWIPDSRIWMPPAKAGLTSVARSASIASSPVVVAISATLARQQHGWPARKPQFSQLLNSTPLGLANSAGSAPTVGAITAVTAMLRNSPGAPATLASVLRRARTDLPPDPARALATVRGPAPIAVAASEQAVYAANLQQRQTATVASYLPGGGMTLDYPFLVLTRSASDQSLADKLLVSLQHGVGRDRLLASGFRVLGAGHNPSLRSDLGVEPEQRASATAPDAATVARALRTLRAVSLPSRILTVVDVSGSMGQPVPGTRGATRLDLVSASAARGLALYPDDTAIGLWVFATDLGRGVDYRELVSIGPLGVRADGVRGRERLVAALGSVRRIPQGDTGLYDTTLAAVRAVRRGWDPSKANSVVLLTDGKNEDRRGIGLPELLSALRQERQAGTNVPVITIAYGTSADVGALRAISAATGGNVYQAPEPRHIDRVFRDAIGRRACAQRC